MKTRLNGVNFRVHTIVAKVWLATPENQDFTQVNHLDENKSNNEVSNLEWSTPSSNVRHSLHKRYKPVIATNLTTGEVRRYDGIKLAAVDLGVKYPTEIGQICNKTSSSKQARGWTFSFA